MVSRPKCVNIDWLEIYCLEPIDSPRDIAYFETAGYAVLDRGYGTKHMAEVFTVMDSHGDPMIEVRRNPRNGGSRASFYPINGCTLRYVNRYCYVPNCVLIMAEFLYIHQFTFKRIARMDIALDFAQFDSGLWPSDVVRRILSHRYAKIYQSDRTARGRDNFDECKENYIAWGNKKSMVSTRFYNKTKELEDTGMKKPWITQQWLEAGIIDNPLYISKDGQHVDVWRLEFQVSSSARGWVILDAANDDENYLEHTLDLYTHKDGLWNAVKELTRHYFNFRVQEAGKSKYECKPVEFFEWSQSPVEYKLTNTAISREYDVQNVSRLRTILRLLSSAGEGKERELLEQLRNIYESASLSQFAYGGMSDKILKLRMALGHDFDSSKISNEDLRLIF